MSKRTVELSDEEYQMLQMLRQQQQQQQVPQDLTVDADKCLEAFIETLCDFLSVVSATFPECAKTREVQQDLETARASKMLRTQVIQKWHTVMSRYYPAIKDRDEETLRNADIEWLSKLNIVEKFDDPLLSQESKDNMWLYLDQLNMFAGMYQTIHKVPNRVLCKIQNAAKDLCLSTSQNGGRMPNVNLTEISKDLLKDASPAEMMQLLQAAPEIFENFGGMDFESVMKDGPESFARRFAGQ